MQPHEEHKVVEKKAGAAEVGGGDRAADGAGAGGRASGTVQQRVKRRAAMSGLQVQARCGPLAPSLGQCSVPRDAPTVPLDAVHCQGGRGSSPRLPRRLRPTLQTSTCALATKSASERLARGDGRWDFERCTSCARSELGSVVGKTASAAQHQRRIEWPTMAARAALNRRFCVKSRLRAHGGRWPPYT